MSLPLLAVLLLLLGIVLPVHAVFPTSILFSGGSSPWTLELTGFELTFVILTLVHIVIFRLMEIAPINLNKFLNGKLSRIESRRRRSNNLGEDPLIDLVVKFLRKLDFDQHCPLNHCNFNTEIFPRSKEFCLVTNQLWRNIPTINHNAANLHPNSSCRWSTNQVTVLWKHLNDDG